MSNIVNSATDFLIKRKFEKAQILFEKEIAATGNLSIAHAGLAICFLMKKDIRGAKKEIELSLLGNESNVLAYIASAILYEMENNISNADSYFAQALNLEPDNLYTLYSYGTFLISRKRIDEGVELLKKAKIIDKNQWALRQNLAVGYSRKHDSRGALKESFAALSLMPSVENFIYTTLYLLKVFPYAIWLIFGLVIYIFILDPKSIISITLLAGILVGFNLLVYLTERKKSELIISVITLISAIVYYFINVK